MQELRYTYPDETLFYEGAQVATILRKHTDNFFSLTSTTAINYSDWPLITGAADISVRRFLFGGLAADRAPTPGKYISVNAASIKASQ